MARRYRRKAASASKDKVYTIRLTPNPDTPEGRACAILERLLNAKDHTGRPLYSLREIVTRALLGLEGFDPDPTERMLTQVLGQMSSMSDMLDRLLEEGIAVGNGRRKKPAPVNIGSKYLANIGEAFED